MSHRILFIDDELDLWLEALQEELAPQGFKVEGEADPKKALASIDARTPDAVLLDIHFPGGRLGKELLPAIKKKFPHLPVMMLTGTMDQNDYHPEDFKAADYRYAKAALAGGDYTDLAEQLRFIIEKQKNTPPKDPAASHAKLGFIAGTSQQMQAAVHTIIKVADQDQIVLITGESGTGKELTAKAVHRLGQRKKEAFVPVVCAALPSELIENELFGHEKGAFTGADSRKLGKIEAADKGTLFLDEIGELKTDTQVKLLRFLQERQYERIGGTQTLSSTARIIAATNRPLEQLVEEGAFRQDLFYRLNVIRIDIPPLRDRMDDLELFFPFFVQRANSASRKKILPILREDVRTLFQTYHWPGNIREFEHVVQRAVAMAEENILQLSNFDIAQTPVEKFSINTVQIVEQIYKGTLSWTELTRRFGSGEVKQEILHALIRAWVNHHHTRPTSRNLADLLQISQGNMRRILSQNNIKLKSFSQER